MDHPLQSVSGNEQQDTRKNSRLQPLRRASESTSSLLYRHSALSYGNCTRCLLVGKHEAIPVSVSLGRRLNLTAAEADRVSLPMLRLCLPRQHACCRGIYNPSHSTWLFFPSLTSLLPSSRSSCSPQALACQHGGTPKKLSRTTASS